MKYEYGAGEKFYIDVIEEDSDSDVSMTSDESGEESGDDEQESQNESNKAEESDEDELVKAIKEAQNKLRERPPEITSDEIIVDISFHTSDDIIATASITGDIQLYRYSVENTEQVRNLEVHTKAARAVEFSENGKLLYSASKDRSIVLSDVETGKMTKFYDGAHEVPLFCLNIIDDNLLASGDEDGIVKLWDTRQQGDKPLCRLQHMDDCVTSMITTERKQLLACTSGEGSVTTYNLNTRKLHMQSELYDADLSCSGLFRRETKLVCGTTKGALLIYNWGEFGLHCDEYPRPSKRAINCLVPVTENIVVTGWEDGTVRATHLFPNRMLGIVGQHSLSVEAMDISHDGCYVASSSLEQGVRFWPIQYFEEVTVPETKPDERHNLPSSQYDNRTDFFAGLA